MELIEVPHEGAIIRFHPAPIGPGTYQEVEDQILERGLLGQR